jgi:hypothetical protein
MGCISRIRKGCGKCRAKEAKQKDPEREEWRRVRDSGSEDERSEGEGGWGEFNKVKRRFGEDSSSSEKSDDDPDDGSKVGRKHRRSTSRKVSKLVRIATPTENVKAAAASWIFSQESVEDAEDEGEDNNKHDLEWQSEVSKHFYLTAAGLNAIYRAMTEKTR